MRVTISNEIIDRTEPDGSVITRIPKRNEYLYLERESVLAHGEHGIVAELEPDRYYVVGGKDPDSTAVRKERGETLSKNYTYIERYDPLVKMAGNQQKQKERSQQQPESPTERLTGQKQQTGTAESKKSVQAQSAEQSANVRQQQTVPKYSREQFRQIKLGQKHHLDTSQAGQEKDLQDTRNTSGSEAEDWNAEAEEWNPENVSDKELFDRIGEEMMLEAQAAQDMEYELVR